MEYGKKVLYERSRQRLTREAVARKAGINAKTVQNIENGAPARIASRLSIARVLGIPDEIAAPELFDLPCAARHPNGTEG